MKKTKKESAGMSSPLSEKNLRENLQTEGALVKKPQEENLQTESALAKKPQEESLQTERGPAGKIQPGKTRTGEPSPDKKTAGKAAWEIPACYVLWAALSVLLTGLTALCLGMNASVSEETGKTLVELLSSLLGSIYVPFLLWRWKEREWTQKKTPEQIRTGLLFGTAFFACRTMSRLAFSLFPETAEGAGYLAALTIDLICITFIYLRLPDGRKEERSHDKH